MDYPKPVVKELPPFAVPRIDLGINVRDEHSQIENGQSPYVASSGRPGALNVLSDGKGGIKKRKGYAQVWQESLGAGGVNGVWDYYKRSGAVIRLIHHGTFLYTQSGSAQPVQILSGLNNTKGAAFTFNDIFYLLDGERYWQYDGTTAGEVVPYAPSISLNRPPNGEGGASDEELNQLGDSWIDSFDGDGTSAIFKLSIEPTAITEVLVDGEPASFTWPTSADLSEVSISPVPALGDNNVKIKAEKDGLNDASYITKNKYAAMYGGRNDTRVHITGNPNWPATVYRSALDDPTYWPASAFTDVGPTSDFNTGLVFQYDMLLVLKRASIWRIEYEIDSETGFGLFPSYPLNDSMGCDMPHTVQLVDNNVVFCHSARGPLILESTVTRTEKNVRTLGDLINGVPGRRGLLNEEVSVLQDATSIDDGTHYVLCVGNKCWAWNYQLSPWGGYPDQLIWWYWNNIPANCWIQRDRDVFFGSRNEGMLYRLTENANDAGAPIDAAWRSKLYSMEKDGVPWSEWLKTITFIFFRTNVTNAGVINIVLHTDRDSRDYQHVITSSSFSWPGFRWDMFSWSVNIFDPIFRIKARLKKIKYISIEFKNDLFNQDLSILDVKFLYSSRIFMAKNKP